MNITKNIMNDKPSPLPRWQQGQLHMVISRRSLSDHR